MAEGQIEGPGHVAQLAVSSHPKTADGAARVLGAAIALARSDLDSVANVLDLSPYQPVTWTDVNRLVVVPSPNSPGQLEPQQRTVPSVSSAHVCCDPAVIWVAFAMPVTWTGVTRLVVVPSPNSPGQLEPQQRTVRSVSSAHVCQPPAVIWVAFAMPVTWTGVNRLVVVPSPKSPDALSPQQRTVPGVGVGVDPFALTPWPWVRQRSWSRRPAGRVIPSKTADGPGCSAQGLPWLAATWTASPMPSTCRPTSR